MNRYKSVITAIILTTVFVGCNKDNKPNPNPEPYGTSCSMSISATSYDAGNYGSVAASYSGDKTPARACVISTGTTSTNCFNYGSIASIYFASAGQYSAYVNILDSAGLQICSSSPSPYAYTVTSGSGGGSTVASLNAVNANGDVISACYANGSSSACTVNIKYNGHDTNSCTLVTVFNGANEVLFSKNQGTGSATVTAPWIPIDGTSTFTLYEVTDCSQSTYNWGSLVSSARITVSGKRGFTNYMYTTNPTVRYLVAGSASQVSSLSSTANQNSLANYSSVNVSANGGSFGTARVVFQTPNTTFGLVTAEDITAGSGENMMFCDFNSALLSTNNYGVAPWIAPGHQYVFKLYENTGDCTNFQGQTPLESVVITGTN